jgi:hypothetical protein
MKMWEINVWVDGPKAKMVWQRKTNIPFPIPRVGERIKFQDGCFPQEVKSIDYDFTSWTIDIVLETSDPGDIYDSVDNRSKIVNSKNA